MCLYGEYDGCSVGSSLMPGHCYCDSACEEYGDCCDDYLNGACDVDSSITPATAAPNAGTLDEMTLWIIVVVVVVVVVIIVIVAIVMLNRKKPMQVSHRPTDGVEMSQSPRSAPRSPLSPRSPRTPRTRTRRGGRSKTYLKTVNDLDETARI